MVSDVLKKDNVMSISREDLVKNLCSKYSQEELAKITISMLVKNSDLSQKLKNLEGKQHDVHTCMDAAIQHTVSGALSVGQLCHDRRVPD